LWKIRESCARVDPYVYHIIHNTTQATTQGCSATFDACATAVRFPSALSSCVSAHFHHMTNPSCWSFLEPIWSRMQERYDLTAVEPSILFHCFIACAEKLSSQLSLHARVLAFVSCTRTLLYCFNHHLTTWTRGGPPISRYLGFLTSETFGIYTGIEIRSTCKYRTAGRQVRNRSAVRMARLDRSGGYRRR